MSNLPGKPPFPVVRMLMYLTATSAAMAAINALVLPAVTGRADAAVPGAMLTAGVVWISCAICLIPLTRASHSGQMVNAFLLGMLIRMSAGAVAAWWAIKGLHMAPVAAVASLMLCYLPALFIETRCIVGHIPALDAWHRQTHGDGGGAPAAGRVDGELRSEKLA